MPLRALATYQFYKLLQSSMYDRSVPRASDLKVTRAWAINSRWLGAASDPRSFVVHLIQLWSEANRTVYLHKRNEEHSFYRHIRGREGRSARLTLNMVLTLAAVVDAALSFRQMLDWRKSATDLGLHHQIMSCLNKQHRTRGTIYAPDQYSWCVVDLGRLSRCAADLTSRPVQFRGTCLTHSTHLYDGVLF